MTQFFDCPNCRKKNVAKRSIAYPNIIVHKCFGDILLEVGTYEKGKITPIFTHKTSPVVEIFSKHFILNKIDDALSVVKFGRELKNNLQHIPVAKMAIQKSQIWTVRKKNGELVYMIVVTNGTIIQPDHFSGMSISPVPKMYGEDILSSLLFYGVINKNPFPHEYTI